MSGVLLLASCVPAAAQTTGSSRPFQGALFGPTAKKASSTSLDISGFLLEAYDDLARGFVTPDPQEVPTEILERRRALEPERELTSSAWARVAGLRDRGVDDRETVADAYRAGGLL